MFSILYRECRSTIIGFNIVVTLFNVLRSLQTAFSSGCTILYIILTDSKWRFVILHFTQYLLLLF